MGILFKAKARHLKVSFPAKLTNKNYFTLIRPRDDSKEMIKLSLIKRQLLRFQKKIKITNFLLEIHNNEQSKKYE